MNMEHAFAKHVCRCNLFNLKELDARVCILFSITVQQRKKQGHRKIRNRTAKQLDQNSKNACICTVCKACPLPTRILYPEVRPSRWCFEYGFSLERIH